MNIYEGNLNKTNVIYRETMNQPCVLYNSEKLENTYNILIDQTNKSNSISHEIELLKESINESQKIVLDKLDRLMEKIQEFEVADVEVNNEVNNIPSDWVSESDNENDE